MIHFHCLPALAAVPIWISKDQQLHVFTAFFHKQKVTLRQLDRWVPAG